MRSIVEAAKMLEGELYPTASSVIPFFDQIFRDLTRLSNNLPEGAGSDYVSTLLYNLKASNRFQNGYKDLAPYNCLTVLDVRYGDLYMNREEVEQAFELIYNRLGIYQYIWRWLSLLRVMMKMIMMTPMKIRRSWM